ncbi:FKBP-type peptidyl-prolyl cis-trans isomerase [Carboxylicivirga linearis]|nr:FKBP-type peptidyl-prolyl cis-trans isomerase [Carboxylicivirga linearis]
MKITGKVRMVGFTSRLLGVLLIGIAVFGCMKDNDDSDGYDVEKQMEIDREIIVNYIADNDLDAAEINYGGYPSGVFYFNHEVADPEDTEKPISTSEVTVAYKGYLLDGTVFDSTPEGESITFVLSGLIGGWQIGIPIMSRGDKLTLIIPSPLGYGPYEAGSIPANSVLLFDIELINFTN